MKRTSLLISAVLLSVTAGVQTATAQKVTLYMADNQTYECDIARLDSIVFSEGQTIIPDEEIVVTVDANGNADGGHQFTRIDETTFLIDGLKYKYVNGDLTVTGYDPVFFSGVAKIISKLIYNGRTMNVVGIDNKAFSECTSLTSITIPNSVTSISNYAFDRCSSLTSITIPESVTSIGNYAFRNCTGLTSITIPENVTSIGDDAFSGCSSLTSVTIPEGVTSIGSNTFRDCSSLTSINIPNNVTSIGDLAFSGCSSLTSITIPESVTSIGKSAFYFCSSLTSITIPNSVTSIGGSAFSGCSGLTSIIVESGNTVYDSRYNCNAIIETATNTLIAGCMNTIIPESVTSIGDYVFSGCTGLTSVTIPNSVTSICNSAFYGCFFKTDFFVNNSSLTSDNNWGATLYDEERSDGLIIINNIVVGCRPWAVSITIPNNVTSIGGRAFSGCSSLTSITIPESVTSIGKSAFYFCSSMTSITIPKSVTSIGSSAFSGCSSLTSVTLESNNIVSAARDEYSSMRTIFGNKVKEYIIGNSVTSIGPGTFFGCTNLTSITIPESVTIIGIYAFRECTSLTEVYCYAENPPSTDSYAFYNSPISSATLHVPAGSVDAYKAAAPWKNFGSIVAIE